MSDLFSEKHYWEIVKNNFFLFIGPKEIILQLCFKCAVDHRHQSFIFFFLSTLIILRKWESFVVAVLCFMF